MINPVAREGGGRLTSEWFMLTDGRLHVLPRLQRLIRGGRDGHARDSPKKHTGRLRVGIRPGVTLHHAPLNTPRLELGNVGGFGGPGVALLFRGVGEVGVGLEEGEGVGPGVGVVFPGLGEGAAVTVYRVVAAVEAPVAGDCVFGLSGVEENIGRGG